MTVSVGKEDSIWSFTFWFLKIFFLCFHGYIILSHALSQPQRAITKELENPQLLSETNTMHKTLWIPKMNWSPFTDSMYSACKYIVNERKCMTRNHRFHQTPLKLMLIRGGSRVFRRGGLSIWWVLQIFLKKYHEIEKWKKESILVGCVPPACQPYVLRWPPDVVTGGELYSEVQCIMGGGHTGTPTPCGQTDWQSHTTEKH